MKYIPGTKIKISSKDTFLSNLKLLAILVLGFYLLPVILPILVAIWLMIQVTKFTFK